MAPGAVKLQLASLILLAGEIVLALLLSGVTSATAQSSTPVRIALVIGNSAYSTIEHSPLPNAVTDADAVAAQLHQLGFSDENIDLEHNVTRKELGPLLGRFGKRLRDAGPTAISFVYYSGHAGQDRGINYLIPVDSDASSPDALKNEATPLQSLLDDMAQTGNAVNVIILDACRDWFENAAPGVDVIHGLSDMGPHDNVFVGLATTPGQPIPDGVGAHSYYATRLIEALATRANQPLPLIFDDIDELVNQDSDHQQHPEFTSNLGVPRWCFNPGPLCGDIETHPPATVYTSHFLLSLDREKLLTLTHDNATFVDTLLSRRDLLAANGIDSPLRLAYFLSAIGYETNYSHGLLQEDLNYSAEELQIVFPSKFRNDRQKAAAYAHNPEKIANYVYALRLGNGDESTGDGWLYRGRGYFSLTGRDTYQWLVQAIGIDLIAAPDLLSNPEVDLAAAAAYWSRGDLNSLADLDDIDAAATAVDGPGFDHARRHAFLLAAKLAAGMDANK